MKFTFRPGRALVVVAVVLLVGCGPSMAPTAPPASPVSQGPLTDLTEQDFIAPYVTACDGFSREDLERITRAIDAVQGKVDRLDGSRHGEAPAEIGALRDLDVDPHVVIPERGFMTVNHNLIERVQELAKTPPSTKKERQAAMELGQKVGAVMPHIMALNSHLYEIQTAQIHSQVHVEICTSYPLAAAVAIGNARHQNLIPAQNPDGDREAVKRVLASSRLSQARSSALLAMFAAFQAAVAGDMEPEELSSMLEACRGNLSVEPSVDDADVEEVLALASTSLEQAREHEAELKALAQQTMRPPPPMAGTEDKITVGKVIGSVLGVLGSLVSGNIAGIVKNVAAIVPQGSPVRYALTAGEAVLNGDYRTALDAAVRLAPAGSPVAETRDLVARVESRATEVKGRVDSAL